MVRRAIIVDPTLSPLHAFAHRVATARIDRTPQRCGGVRRRRFALVAVATVLVAGCGGGGKDRAAPPSTTTSVGASTTPTAASASASESTTLGSASTTSRTTTTTVQGTRLRAELTGAAGVPGPPDKGSVELTVDTASARACTTVLVREVGRIRAIHVHSQMFEPIVLASRMVGSSSPLALEPQPGQGQPGRSGYAGNSSECTQLTGAEAQAMASAPAAFRFEVHTDEFPGGAASGPLAPA